MSTLHFPWKHSTAANRTFPEGTLISVVTIISLIIVGTLTYVLMFT